MNAQAQSQASKPSTTNPEKAGLTKTKATVGKKISAKPQAAPTLSQLAQGYIQDLEKAGKSHGTIFSYGMELKIAMGALGAKTPIASLTPEKVEAFFKSNAVTKTRTGKPKARPSIDKTRRVLRQALVWAAETGLIDKAPVPETELRKKPVAKAKAVTKATDRSNN